MTRAEFHAACVALAKARGWHVAFGEIFGRRATATFYVEGPPEKDVATTVIPKDDEPIRLEVV